MQVYLRVLNFPLYILTRMCNQIYNDNDFKNIQCPLKGNN